ncbi:hypothetical protein DPMN_130520 [Dreissena polymorpha]|uniref:Uncharacterized protein n=1 Tax=Dreissena polymorpha TaxID=45954 RepID=A0A9D4H7W3_DREPO|nr:hypothetical protein DPMN_130520 [Dreissena polymorpha]
MWDEGRDTIGVSLFDTEVITEVWARQRKHVQCIQDTEGISLFTVTGMAKKAGMVLCKYRCARGSVFLGFFHNHFAKFIPGTTSSETHFQSYVLDGLKRWNEDLELVTTGYSNYSGQMLSTVNELSLKLLDRKLIVNFRPPMKYTGEYLCNTCTVSANMQVISIFTVSNMQFTNFR